jgi:creatinine amidohydrolase/Fe(II)-dependent formamide hydrolase-like protein
LASLFSAGVESVASNGVLGDPSQASAEHGQRYWEAAVDLVVEALGP